LLTPAAAITSSRLAPFALAHAVLTGMIAAGWGRIVNVSSGTARNPFARTEAYSTSKTGLDMLTRQLGVELAETGVVVTAVYLGMVDTAMPALIRAQSETVIGAATAQRFRQARAAGALAAPERPATLIAAIVAATDSALNGRIVDIHDEDGQRLVTGDKHA